MYEATFRIEGRGAFSDITRDVSASIELWCNDHCDLLRVSGEQDGATLQLIKELTGVRDSVSEASEEVIITEDCLERYETTMIDTLLSQHDCLMLPPLTYENGYKTCRVLALEPENLTTLYRDLLDRTSVVVESKREVNSLARSAPMLTLWEALPSLSERQRQVLLEAYDLGYYEIPRRTTTEEIAAVVGIERRTAEQHLRRAENKLMESMVKAI